MIILKDINLSFGNKKILENVNLSINNGEKFLLNQKSGSGKTTLMKTLMGFAIPDSGEIIINSNTLNSNNINKVRTDIFYLDQDVTLPEMNINELIDEVVNYKNNKQLNITYNLVELLDEFKLNVDILNKNIKELSGGERQRVGLIIGLILNRPIWLLDEPTSALDIELKEIVKQKLENLEVTALIISHDSCWKDLPKMEWCKR